MGNLCIVDNNKKNKKYYLKCSKCKDHYSTSHGRYSERRSCRIHQLNESNFCIGCREQIKYHGQTCYHY